LTAGQFPGNKLLPITYTLKNDEVFAQTQPRESMQLRLWFNGKPALEEYLLRYCHVPADRKMTPGDTFPAHFACVSVRPELLACDPKAAAAGGPLDSLLGTPGIRPYPKDYLARIRYGGQTVYTYYQVDRDGMGRFIGEAYLAKLAEGVHDAEVLVVTEDGRRLTFALPIEIGAIGGLKDSDSIHKRNLKIVFDDVSKAKQSGGKIDAGRKSGLVSLLISDADNLLKNGTFSAAQAVKQLQLAMDLHDKVPEKPSRSNPNAKSPFGNRPSHPKPKPKEPSPAIKRIDLLDGVFQVCRQTGAPEAYAFAEKQLAACASISVNDPEAVRKLPRLYKQLAAFAVTTQGDIEVARRHLAKALEIELKANQISSGNAESEKQKWPKHFVDANMKAVQQP
jgi:hypothetical protein